MLILHQHTKREAKTVQPNYIFLGDSPTMDKMRTFLRQEACPGMEARVILFEVQRIACPYELITLLETMDNKQLLLVALTPLAYSDDFHLCLEDQILPFLPESCRYLGLKLVPGTMEPESLLFLFSFLPKTGRGDKLPRLRQAYADTHGHPNANDAKRLCESIEEAFPRTQNSRQLCR